MIATLTVSRGNFERETAKAYKIDDEWFPKSQITVWQNESEPEYQRTYFIALPIWLAKAKGLWGYNCYGKPVCALIENEQEAHMSLSQSWTVVTEPIRD